MKKYLGFLIFTLLVIVCATTQNYDQDNCITNDINYSFREYPPSDNKPYPTKIPLNINWQPQLDEVQAGKIEPSIIRSISIQPDDTIWFPTDHNIVEYKTTTKDLIIYNKAPLPYELHVDKKGNLWGIENIITDFTDTGNNPPYFLLRYNNFQKEFEIIPDKTLTGRIDAYSEDNEGNLYFYTEDERLIKFNIKTEKAESIPVNLSNYKITTMAIDKENNLWFFGYLSEKYLHIGQILKFGQTDKSIKVYISVPELHDQQYSKFFIDSENKLWVNDLGYVDNTLSDNPVWYQMVRSPIFIHNRGPIEIEYQWSNAHAIFESSDHLLWFFSSAGLANLNQNAEKWCLVTSRITAVTEDSENNLWIVDEGQIYKRTSTSK